MVNVVLTQQEIAALFRWMSTFSATLNSNNALTEGQVAVLDGFVHSVGRVVNVNAMDRTYVQSLQGKIEIAYGSWQTVPAQQPPT